MMAETEARYASKLGSAGALAEALTGDLAEVVTKDEMVLEVVTSDSDEEALAPPGMKSKSRSSICEAVMK
jgi:hypothetical protein